MAQVVLRVIEGGEGVALGLFVSPNSNYYMGMAAIRRHVYSVYLNWEQPRIGHLEAD